MSAIDTTGPLPTPEPITAGNLEAIKEQEEENKLHQELNERVKEEAPNEKVYKALENFLLADPERQIPQLGGSEGQLSEGDAARKNGEMEIARGNYESAAKIELYKQNREEARKYILMADEVTDPKDYHHEMHMTLLSNMDEALRIARDYYQKLVEEQKQRQLGG